MSLLDFLGAGKTIQQAQEATQQVVQELAPLMQDVENRAGGILHGLLDRLNGTTIEVKINIPPVPKAIPVNSPQS